MRDARRRPRDVVDQFLPVHDRETDALIGYLADVNVDGGMLEVTEALEERVRYPLRIKLGERIDGASHIDVDATCVWNRKDRNAVFHRVGMEFVDVSADARSLLQEVARRFRLTATR